MSQEELEYQVELIVGYESSTVLRSALERCRDGRYRMRDRREQLLGEFVDAWQNLQPTLRRANLALTQMRYQSTKDQAYRVIQEATTISRRAVSSLACCLPVRSMARAREQEEKFLFNIARDYSINSLLSSMPAVGERVKLAVQSSIREEENMFLASRRRTSGDDGYSSTGYIDDGYGSYTSSRNSSTRALASAYVDTYSTPRTAPTADYDPPRIEWRYVDAEPSNVYREPQRFRDYSSPALQGYSHGAY